jgi:hypothetical protein
MPTPQTAATEPESPEPDEDDVGGTATVVDGEEIEEELADPVPGGRSGGEFFAGEDDLDTGTGSTPEPTGTDEAAGDIDEMLGDEPPEQHSFEEPIVEGFARMAVIGLDDDEKDELEPEFVDVFEAFQLGHYGDQVLHEYVLVGDDDINPLYGLAGSMLMCTVLTVYMRPDGDEIVSSVRDRMAELREPNE